MLREITVEEFESLSKRPVHPDKSYAAQVAAEAGSLDDGVFEVDGWPSGESETYHKAADRASKLRAALKGHANMKVRQRGTRLFIVKGENDG